MTKWILHIKTNGTQSHEFWLIPHHHDILNFHLEHLSSQKAEDVSIYLFPFNKLSSSNLRLLYAPASPNQTMIISPCTKCIISRKCYSESDPFKPKTSCGKLVTIESHNLLSCLQDDGPIVFIGDSRLRELYFQMVKVMHGHDSIRTNL